MAIMAMDMRNKTKLASLIALIMPFSSIAGEWQFTPNVLLDETYTDNATLSDGNETSSLVTQTGLGLNATYKAKKTEFNFVSDSRYVFYSHDHDLDNDYHTLSAKTRIGLVPDGLAFVASVGIANESKNNSRNALADLVSADTVRRVNYQTGLQYKVDNSHYLLNSAFSVSSTQYEDKIGESDNINFSLNTQNGDAAKHVFWDFSTSQRKRENSANIDSIQQQTELKLGWITGYKILPFFRYYNEDNKGSISSRNIGTDSYGVGLRWFVTPRFYLDASYNHPIDDNNQLTVEQKKNYWDYLVRWQPTNRTSLSYNHSKRFYGDSDSLSITHKNRRLSNTISYSEDVQSFTRDFFVNVSTQLYCPNSITTTGNLAECLPTTAPDIPADYVLISVNGDQLIENDSYSLNKTFSWSSTLTLRRTSFNLTFSKSRRNSLNLGSDQDNTRVGFTATHKLSEQSDISLKLNYTERVYDDSLNGERSDDYRRYAIEYGTSLNNQLHLKSGVNYTDRTSNETLYNYQEHRIYLQLNKDF